MIITISGLPGSGKTTVMKYLAKKLDYEPLSMGDLRGIIAQRHNMTIDELNNIGKKEDWTDKEPDEELIRIGKEEDDYVIDTWIGFHFIPNSVKIYLDVDPRVAAERIFKNQRPDESHKDTVEEIRDMLEARVRNSDYRYQKYYGIQFMDKKNYDLVIDTSHITEQQTADKILDYIGK